MASRASSRRLLGEGEAVTVGAQNLTGMRERAELIGGSLEVGPTPAGFRVRLWVPR